MTMPAPRPRGTRQALAGTEFAVGRVARPTVLAVAWRWRYEALLAVVTTLGTCLLAEAAGWLGTCIITGFTAGLVILVRPLRAQAVALAWCIVTPHRVRTGMAQAWVHSRDGKIPVVLRTSRQRYGERVHVWCRAGTSAEDFVWASHLIAAACWAREVRVSRSRRFPHIVVLEIIRRDENRDDGRRHGPRSGASDLKPVRPADGDGPTDGLANRTAYFLPD